MKIGNKMIVSTLLFLAFCAAAGGKEATTRDGAMTVSYNISNRVDENGDTVPLIEYIATTRENVSMEECISVMKDAAKHKEFQGDDVSDKIRTVSATEWVLYYFTKGGGPFPDSDVVSLMTFSEDAVRGTASFSITAAPDLSARKKNVRRFTLYTMLYTFKDAGNGMVDITVSARMSPVFSVPAWMINAAFPDAAFDVLRKFTQLANAK